MREIKFRIWSVYSEMMIEDSFYISQVGEMFEGDCLDYRNKNAFKIMQYTGLKDKEGNEIYEGDILAVGSEDYLMQVIWISESWGYEVIKNETNRGYIVGHKSRGGLCFYIDLVDVFGNIYKNPELLKRGE